MKPSSKLTSSHRTSCTSRWSAGSTISKFDNGRRRSCVRAQYAAKEDSATATRSIYGPTLRAMKAGSGARSELERELFGEAATPSWPRIAPTLHDVRTARSVSEMQQLLAQAEAAQALSPAFLSAVLSSLPKLRKHQHRDSLNQLVESATQRLLPLVDSLSAHDLVAAAVALAKLGHEDSHIYKELARCSVPHIQDGDMQAQGLSNLLWALAIAGVRPCGAWLSVFWQVLEHQMELLSSQDIANIFWSICRLELMPPWVSAPMPNMLRTALKRVGSAQTGEDPATVMVCLAIWSRSYSYHPPEAVMSELLGAMQPQLRHYGPQDLVSIVHSLVVMNASPSRAWMTDFYVVLRDRHPCPQDLARLLWALSRIDYVPSQAWLRHFVEGSLLKLRQLRFRALAELVWALSCWGYTPSKDWLAEYFRCTYPKLEDYKPSHLANTLLALKKLGCQVPTLWLDAALTSFCTHLSEAKAHDLVTFIDSCVDICDDPAWMSKPSTGRRLRALADHAASKFVICDTLMNAKLLIALATAKCFPGAAWLNAQQDSLARSLGAEEPGALDTVTAGNVRAAYAAFDVPVSPVLAQELDAQTRSS